jgi:hypothetical protein
MSSSSIDGVSEEEESALLFRLQQGQIKECTDIIDGVVRIELDQGITPSELDPVRTIKRQKEKMEEKTSAVFSDPDAIRDINLYLRRILIGIADDLGYGHKVDPLDTESVDDISTLFYWYRTMMIANLEDSYQSVDHEYVVHALKSDRNDIEHGSAGSDNRPDVIGLAILSWYALGKILTNWRAGKHQYSLGGFDQIEDDSSSYGYITKLEKDDTKITPFERGVDGDNINFNYTDIGFCPEIGAPVKFEIQDEDGMDIAIEVSKLGG